MRHGCQEFQVPGETRRVLPMFVGKSERLVLWLWIDGSANEKTRLSSESLGFNQHLANKARI